MSRKVVESIIEDVSRCVLFDITPKNHANRSYLL